MKDKKIDVGISDSAGFNQSFKSLKEFLTFCKNEADFWKSEGARNNTQSKRSHNCFSADGPFFSIVSGLENWGASCDSWDDNELSNNLNSLISPHRSFLTRYWIWSAHGFTRRFLDVLERHGVDAANAFFLLLFKDQ